MTTQPLANQFAKRFGKQPDVVVRAPGRINLIGDHTDYNDGLVLPIAIDRSVLIAARRLDRPALEVESLHFGERLYLPLAAPLDKPESPWARYMIGVAAMLRRQKIEPPGASLLIGGDLPPGAGLASSAALEVATALALLHLAEAKLTKVATATLCRRAEHEYADSPCGIMDQLCCVLARADHALLIDCRSMMSEPIPLALPDAAIVVMDTGVRHSIAGRQYALRRRECAAAVATIGDEHPKVTSMRHVTEENLEALSMPLDETLARRVRHAVTETARVVQAADALRGGDLSIFGCLMNESHASLRDDFEVSCEELDHLVAIAQKVPGVFGARMTGGGFGGCAIALAEADAVEKLTAAVRAGYDDRFEDDAELFTVRADGAAALELRSSR